MEIKVDKKNVLDDCFMIQCVIDDLKEKVKDKKLNELLDNLHGQVDKIIDVIDDHY